jgi:mediator of RNA polymerase II transcription subunit 5
MEVVALQLEAVMELPVLNTRAGLYIFLNSLVCLKLASNVLIAEHASSLRGHLQTTFSSLVTFIPVAR